jgi:hypothetical protein
VAISRSAGGEAGVGAGMARPTPPSAIPKASSSSRTSGEWGQPDLRDLFAFRAEENRADQQYVGEMVIYAHEPQHAAQIHRSLTTCSVQNSISGTLLIQSRRDDST